MRNTTTIVSGIKPSTIARVLRLGANPQLPLEDGEELVSGEECTKLRRIIVRNIFKKSPAVDKSDARWVLAKLQQINKIYLSDHSQAGVSHNQMAEEAEAMPELCIEAPALAKTTD